MQLPVDSRLRHLESAVGAVGIDPVKRPIRAEISFVGCRPIPDRTSFFGKMSSCLVGRSVSPSCAEVELVDRLRESGWEAGWPSAYTAGRTFPSSWRKFLFTPAQARDVLSVEFPSIGPSLEAAVRNGRNESGIPDVVAARDGRVLVIECKRERGRYIANDGTVKLSKGDALKKSQTGWIAQRQRVLGEAYVELWWTRLEPEPHT